MIKGQQWKRELSDWQSTENYMLQAVSAALAASKLSMLLFFAGFVGCW